MALRQYPQILAKKGVYVNMGVYRRGKRWWMRYALPDGKILRESAFSTNKQIAERALAKRREEIALGIFKLQKKNEDISFIGFSEEYLVYSKVNKRSYRRDITSLNNLKPFFRDKKLSVITCYLVESYKTKRSQEVSKATVNRELACLKHMFNMAIKWDKASLNPVREVKFFKEGPWKMRILSREEEKLLLESACDHLKPIIVAALNTGMRRGEIFRLTWDNVDFFNGTITVVETKNGETRIIPMNQLLRETLQQLRMESKTTHVFCGKDGKPLKDVRTAFETVKKKTGIHSLRFHDLRHTFATRLIEKGVDLPTVKKILGHKSINMTLRYIHPVPEHMKWAVEILNVEVPEKEAEKTPEAYNRWHKNWHSLESLKGSALLTH